MVLEFQSHSDECQESWSGEIILLQDTEPFQMIVNAHGYSFNIIFGHGICCNYLCIPNWNVGAELSSFDDKFWNKESIRRASADLSDIELNSIVDAIAEANRYINN